MITIHIGEKQLKTLDMDVDKEIRVLEDIILNLKAYKWCFAPVMQSAMKDNDLEFTVKL